MYRFRALIVHGLTIEYWAFCVYTRRAHDWIIFNHVLSLSDSPRIGPAQQSGTNWTYRSVLSAGTAWLAKKWHMIDQKVQWFNRCNAECNWQKIWSPINVKFFVQFLSVGSVLKCTRVLKMSQFVAPADRTPLQAKRASCTQQKCPALLASSEGHKEFY